MRRKLIVGSRSSKLAVIQTKSVVAHIKEANPDTKVLVGGAPLNDDFRSKIGADFYAPDPRGAVEYLKSFVA